LHSSASDGTYHSRDLVRMAIEKRLAAISITDHDTVAGIGAALEAAEGTDLALIPGIELSAVLDAREVHLLGYFIDPTAKPLQETLALLADSRTQRARRIIAKLTTLGLPLHWEKISDAYQANGVIGRPHIARALINEGYVHSVEEAFALYLGHGAPAYVPRYKLSPAAAVKLILEAGGLPVLAHPLDVTDLVPTLVEQGLAGIEAFYRGYTLGQISELLSLAKRFKLLTTGGTDFHDDGQSGSVAMGSVYVPANTVDKLRARLSR
jgi:predicted metal-dependent phosphoesterase TrpH